MKFRVPAFLLWKKPAENSVPYRVATLATVMCGIAAVLHEQDWPGFSWAVVVGTVAGSVLSHWRREHSNWGLKIVLSLLMMVALFDFITNLVYNPYDPRVPLANLLLWLQTLHSFDLPARRDLNYSLLVGFILVNVAGVLSHDLTYVIFLVAFVACVLVTLQYNYISQASEGAEVFGGEVPFRLVLRQARGLALALMLLGLGTFLLLPRFDNMRIRPMPISFNIKLPNLTQGRIQNPAYPETAGRMAGRRQFRRFDSESYMGFNAFVDLNLRGRLSDEITMRVRSSEETYYRGLAFNHYTGDGWEMSGEDLQRRTAVTPPLFVEPETGGTHEVAQIFYIEKEMANVVFAAYHPFQIFFPTDMLYTDRHSGVRAPFPLQPGLVYSVVSLTKEPASLTAGSLARHRPSVARRLDFVKRARALDMNLPDRLPQRVRDLALEITRNRRSSFARAAAINLYLKSQCEYTLDLPPYPEGRDVVDEFLFEQRRGYCEHFATSMVVLCRAAGIPARYVTGYLPGTYNPFTGYYEVKCSDAHAWVEVMIDSFGWVAFDPTPGYDGVPLAVRHDRGKWVLGSLLTYLQRRLGLEDGALGRIYEGARQRLVGLVASLRAAGAVGWVVLVTGPVLLLLGVVLLLRRAARPVRTVARAGLAAVGRNRGRGLAEVLDMARRLFSLGHGEAEAQGGVALAWRDLVKTLDVRGCCRQPWQTPREFGEAAGGLFPRAAAPIREMAEAYTQACYRGAPVTGEEVEAARRCLAAVAEALKAPETSKPLETPTPPNTPKASLATDDTGSER